MTKMAAKVETDRFNHKRNKDEFVRFYREQLISMTEQLAAQVKHLDDAHIADQSLHNLLNRALYFLADYQSMCKPSDFDPEF